jgi:enoyl-CoA hydratase/carnithine racemase
MTEPMTDDVLIRANGPIGHISLNRPKALHALTLEMCHAMSAALSTWAADDSIKAVILDHVEGRGFCAGGDIAFLRDSALNDGGVSGRKFFHDEYQLNHQMFTYAKPIVAFMDGITMGGGVGISQPAKFRVATENTRFAMPETGIGLFPDVGGGWFLNRVPGEAGLLLAMTGIIVNEADALYARLADHAIAHARQPAFVERLAALDWQGPVAQCRAARMRPRSCGQRRLARGRQQAARHQHVERGGDLGRVEVDFGGAVQVVEPDLQGGVPGFEPARGRQGDRGALFRRESAAEAERLEDGEFARRVRVIHPMIEAAPLERIMHLAGAVRGDDDNGRRWRLDGAQFRDRGLKIGQDFEQEGLEGLVGAVQFVDQQYGRAGNIRLQRLQKRPLDEEPL